MNPAIDWSSVVRIVPPPILEIIPVKSITMKIDIVIKTVLRKFSHFFGNNYWNDLP